MIRAEPLEKLVTEAVMLRLDSPELAAALTGKAQEAATIDVAGELAADEAHLDELAAAYGEKLVTLREYLAARRPIETRIEAARKRLSRVTGTAAIDGFVGDAARLRDAWAEMSIARRQAVIGVLLDRVVIGPAVRGRNRFDPDRATPVWKY